MCNTAKLQNLIKVSPQFRQVARFIQEITDQENCIDVNGFQYLAECPRSGKTLPPTVANISTNLFTQLFTMKPTSCERYLRRYKQLTK